MKPSLKVETLFGEARLTISDEEFAVGLWMTREGVVEAIALFEQVLESIDIYNEKQSKEKEEIICSRCGQSTKVPFGLCLQCIGIANNRGATK